MRVDLITIFPDYFAPLKLSLFGKAQEAGLVEVEIHDLRSFTLDKHKTVDDAPYGGGPGMVMSPVVWGDAIDSVLRQTKSKPVLVVPTPSGKVFNQEMAIKLASFDTKVLSLTGPHLNLPTIAPVDVCTFGTPPVRSISFTTTAGDCDGVNSAITLILFRLLLISFHNTVVQWYYLYNLSF